LFLKYLDDLERANEQKAELEGKTYQPIIDAKHRWSVWATVTLFRRLPEGLFDFIIIDECHRGGANDESNWRDILNYFSPAVQLGLAAETALDVLREALENELGERTGT
jgi:type I site-specific restriction endonuclease